SYLEPLIKIKQGADLHSSIPMQALLHGLLQHDNFETHISTICALYKSRYDVMFAELQKQLPESCLLKPVDGGMFV
ncbi:GntR family transcriptional regulator, partial [Vibrio parahaemolyticus]